MLTFLTLFTILTNYYSSNAFTGDITYQYIGWGGYTADTTEFVFGDDFYFRREIGGVLNKPQFSHLNSEFLLDIENRVHYMIYDNHVKSEKLVLKDVTTFYDFEVVDTIEYLGHECKVIYFMMKDKFSDDLTNYKYYYPIDIYLPDLYMDIPTFFSNFNSIFRPFDEKFVPLYIEVSDANSESVRIIKAIKIHQRKVNRKKYFDILNQF